MSKKAPQPSSSPQPAGGVDFLYRTMIERESTGKRRIRPKNVDDLEFLQSTLAEESDDPDFDFDDEDSDSEGVIESEEEDGSTGSKSEEEGEKAENAEDDSDESDDEDFHLGKGSSDSSGGSDSDSESGSDGSESSDDEDADNSDSDEPDTGKKSALRESLQKFDDEANKFMSKKPARKKKKKVTKGSEKPAKKVATGKKSKGKSESQTKSSNKTKSKSKTKKGETETKKVKGKKSVVVKKPKVVSKKTSSEKEKKKKRKNSGEKSPKSKKPSILSLLDGSEIKMLANRKEIDLNKRVCSACLKDNSDESNEIVECDSCGITVHETCYGLFADNLSIASGSGSSSSTEPWFCDVCRSGGENISCELCPVEGGLFKESTSGRWVHLVCALYTPGVVVHNDSSINLYALQYQRWGSHNCAACENERLAQTGIVISCDAGLCKTYFHATCAQRQGFLSDPVDPTQVDFQEADPYFVSCKMHTNREAMKRRIKQFNVLQEQLRIKKMRKEANGLPSSGATVDHARIVRKLDRIRQKTAKKRAIYLQSLENVPPLPTTSSNFMEQATLSGLGPQPNNLPDSWTNKKHRMLHTSAKLGRDFLNKSILLGDNISAEELEVKHEKIVSNIKRKWNVLPAMSVEYAAYYSDRESRISSLLEQHDKAVKQNHELMEKDERLADMLETCDVNREAMEEENESVHNQLATLANLLKSVLPGDKQLSTKLNKMTNIKDTTSGRRKSPSTSRGDRKSPSPRRMSVASGKKSPRGKSALIKVCDTCSKSDNQHLITICDKCRKNYHLGCLDPPLDRMPKRTRLCGWICSDCGDAASEDESHVDTEAPRTLRGRTKIHKPRKYRGSDDSDVDLKQQPQGDQAVVTKRPKSSPKMANLTEVKVENTSSASTPNVPQKKVAAKKKRVSRIKSSENAVSPVNGPISLLNGPNVDVVAANVESGVASIASLPGVEIQPADIKSETGKKRKSKSPMPKAPRDQINKVVPINETDVIPPTSPVRTTVVSPQGPLRKSDGPLTSYKVNGINIEDASLPITPKQKQKRPRKNKNEGGKLLTVEEATKNGLTLASGVDVPNLGVVKVKVAKPKKPKVKKEALPNVSTDLEQSVTSTASTSTLAAPANAKPPKKPRINKKALAAAAAAAMTSGIALEQGEQKPVRKPKAKKIKVVDGAAAAVEAPLSTPPGPTDVKPVKVKKPRVKSPKKAEVGSSAEVSVGGGGESTVPTAAAVEVPLVDADGNPIKPKRKYTKKVKPIPDPSQPAPATTVDQVDGKPVKVKKPRKKKEPPEAAQIGEDGTPIPPEKKVKKKPVKPRISTVMTVAISEQNGVNEVLGRMTQITKSVVVDNMNKSMQNGTAKTTKKRKSSTGGMAPPSTNVSLLSSPEDKEKEKSVPPKKRKRAPSNAQMQQQQGVVGDMSVNNSVDSIIHAVSCGDVSEQTLENGDVGLNSSQMSTIMRGVVPRQLAPEQNIMQGKQMGSGVNSGEMVTVDASFLLDCAPSSEANYHSSSVPTFYSSSNSQINNGPSQKESTLQVNAGSNSEQNVIRLQYIEDASTSTASNIAAMPLPITHHTTPNPSMSSFSGVCATCTKTDNKLHLVMCDKCQLEFHFMCLIPPVKYNPRKKGHPWFCRDCDDGEPQENGIIRHMQ